MLQGPGDEPFVEEALKNMKGRALGIAAGLPLGVFAALIKECDLVVVNDTGPMIWQPQRKFRSWPSSDRRIPRTRLPEEKCIR